MGRLLLQVLDSSQQILVPVADGTGADRVPIRGGDGEVTLEQTFVVPAVDATFVRVWARLEPASFGATASTSVTFSIQR